MTDKKDLVLTPRYPHLLHGGDYNPEQWLSAEGVFERDIEYMKKAGVNCVSVGIFSWAMLEPEEGRYDFSWLDKVINTLYENGIYTILATPSGARPRWLTEKYPEVSRVEKNLIRNHHGGRHNHCYTSPVYREKTYAINKALAERYSGNPAVIMWHVSNEISGQCFCPLCQEAFRGWLKEKYHNNIDELNAQWWTTFWSQKYFSFDDVEPPLDNGVNTVHGLNLDWNRFCSEQSVDFYRNEISAVREVNPDIPCTINMMMFHTAIDYNKFVPYLDAISWDAYPMWHMGSDGDETYTAMTTAFNHDWMRSFKNKPFLLMENTPSTTNWCDVSRLRHPDMLNLSSVQALAHGSDSVQYFQLRQSNGSCEKFHSAVISHRGRDDTMTFKSVAGVGKMLSDITDEVYPTNVNARVGLIYDVENKWAIELSRGPRNKDMGYESALVSHYRTFWENGVSVDVIDSSKDFSRYDILIAPMLYMLKGDAAKRLKEFVKSGKTLVATYFTGLVNENDLCFNGDIPGQGLDELFGLWQEDIDGLYDWQENSVVISDGNLKGKYKSTMLCDIVHATTAEVIGVYGSDWYKGFPALLKNKYGDGEAYYIATNADYSLLKPFYEKLITKHGIKRALGAPLPHGVTASVREGENGGIIFVQNFLRETISVSLPDGEKFKDIQTGEEYSSKLSLKPYGTAILKKS